MHGTMATQTLPNGYEGALAPEGAAYKSRYGLCVPSYERETDW